MIQIAKSENKADLSGFIDDWLNREIAAHDGIEPHEVTPEYVDRELAKLYQNELIRIDRDPVVGPPLYVSWGELKKDVDRLLGRTG